MYFVYRNIVYGLMMNYVICCLKKIAHIKIIFSHVLITVSVGRRLCGLRAIIFYLICGFFRFSSTRVYFYDVFRWPLTVKCLSFTFLSYCCFSRTCLGPLVGAEGEVIGSFHYFPIIYLKERVIKTHKSRTKTSEEKIFRKTLVRQPISISVRIVL